ncbi:antirestriction protein [uncultured Desulfobulbus sp.]|uniref:antirestriction protein n=1 Tax=uncultured Desulfobulbus sp. TaxID=239745 RepID=UPI0029C70B82|nr:antirestriction protein [uncultured Desulfobulbus sp.]
MNRELLNNDDRINFPADLFGVHFPFRVEPRIYVTAGRLSTDYRGGYWLMYRLENGGFYMAPDADAFQVVCMNGYEGPLSGDAFGITVCLYAYSELCFSGISRLVEVCSEQYHLLREYMFEHPEVAAILRAID